MSTVRVIDALENQGATLRVAAYCRVSSDSADQLHSCASQVRYYTELINNTKGWQLVDIYADEGVTGTSMEKRDEFNRMMRDARRGRIDKILAKSSSRFARNTHDCLAALRELKSMGVSVRFEKEKLDTENLETELMLTISGSLAQEESVSISNNQRISYKHRMERGDFITCKAPFGYELVNGRELRIIEEEAKIVRWIFESYLSGISLYSLAEEITAMGIPTTDGNPRWLYSTLNYLIHNEKYMGDTLAQKTFVTDVFPTMKVPNKGEKAQYYIRNTHPAIISRETFEQAQELCRRRRPYAYTDYAEYPLTKKLVCGECGTTFKRRSTKNGYVCWVCMEHDKSSASCGVGRIAESEIYAAFMRMCGKLQHNNGDILNTAIKQLAELQNALMRGNPEMLSISTETAKMTEQSEVLGRLRAKGLLDTDTYISRCNGVNARLQELRTRKRRLLQAQDDDTLEQLRELDEIIRHTEINENSFDAGLFAGITEKIIVESQERIRIRLMGGLELSERIHGKGR